MQEDGGLFPRMRINSWICCEWSERVESIVRWLFVLLSFIDYYYNNKLHETMPMNVVGFVHNYFLKIERD